MLAAGAWTSMRAADGRRPVDIALDHGHEHLVDALTPRFTRSGSLDDLEVRRINRRFRELVLQVAGGFGLLRETPFRHVDATVLLEDAGPDRIRLTIPGMYGGFSLQMRDGVLLHARSSSRMAEGSAMPHVITPWEVTSRDHG